MRNIKTCSKLLITIVAFLFTSCANFLNEKLLKDSYTYETSSGYSYSYNKNDTTLKVKAVDPQEPFSVSIIPMEYLVRSSKIILEEGITRLADYAFEGANALYYEFPKGITSIGKDIFKGSFKFNFLSYTDFDGINSDWYCYQDELGWGIIKTSDAVRLVFFGNAEIPDDEYFYSSNYGESKVRNKWCNSEHHITEIDIKEGITRIGAYAFYKLDKSSTSENVLDYSEKNLLGVSNDDLNYSVKSIKIPNSVTSIGQRAFAGLVGVSNLQIPHMLDIVGDEVCYGWTEDQTINLNTELTLDEFLFVENRDSFIMFSSGNLANLTVNDVKIPSSELMPGGIKVITDEYYGEMKVFGRGPVNLIEILGLYNNQYPYQYHHIIIGGEITHVYTDSVYVNNQWYDENQFSFSLVIETPTCQSFDFQYCNSITSIICNSITSIPSWAFYACDSLNHVEADSVVDIGECAFLGCSSLQSLYIPAVTSIRYDAFSGCSSLQSPYIPAVTSIGSYAFSGCSSLKDLYLPAVTSIEDHAFWGCSSLQYLYIPYVTFIGASAFSGCKLESVELSSIEDIPNEAFYDCEIENLYLYNLLYLGSGDFHGSIIKNLYLYSTVSSFSHDVYYDDEEYEPKIENLYLNYDSGTRNDEIDSFIIYFSDNISNIYYSDGTEYEVP